MFYENLNLVLGQLFYYAASVNGNIHTIEKETVHELVQKNWSPLEHARDRFGTDLAYQIDFAFDFEEANIEHVNGWEVFRDFYLQNRREFTPVIKTNILKTITAIAISFHGKSRREAELINKVQELLRR